MSKLSRFATCCAVVLTSCVSAGAFAQENPSLSFLALGDAGLHLDWYDQDDFDKTKDEFIASERADWLEDLKPADEFAHPPIYVYPETGYAVEQPGQFATAKAMQNYCAQEHKRCEFMIVLGDNIYPDGADGSGSESDQKMLWDILEAPYAELGLEEPMFKMYAALGNHDWKSSRAGRDAQIDFGAREDTRYTMAHPGFYTYRRGPAQFWALDTEMLLANTVVYKDRLDERGHEIVNSEPDPAPEWAKPQTPEEYAQLQWLAESMASSDAEWKFVYGHHTLWSAGGSKFGEAHALRPLLLPILCRHADAWFNGHEHDLGVFSDSCESVLGHSDSPLPIIVSGAGAKQRAINTRFHEYQEATYPAYEGYWMQGMTWGFAHVELFDQQGRVSMITTPNDQSGVPEHAFDFMFENREDMPFSPPF